MAEKRNLEAECDKLNSQATLWTLAALSIIFMMGFLVGYGLPETTVGLALLAAFCIVRVLTLYAKFADVLEALEDES